MKRRVARVGCWVISQFFLCRFPYFGHFVSDLKGRSDPIFNCISTTMASNEALRAGWVGMAVRGNDNGSGAINKFGGGPPSALICQKYLRFTVSKGFRWLDFLHSSRDKKIWSLPCYTEVYKSPSYSSCLPFNCLGSLGVINMMTMMNVMTMMTMKMSLMMDEINSSSCKRTLGWTCCPPALRGWSRTTWGRSCRRSTGNRRWRTSAPPRETPARD